MKVTARAITRSLALVVITVASVMLAVTPAVAAGPASAPLSQAGSVTPSGTVGYDMSTTLPSIGMSGCMICHGDKSFELVNDKNGKSRNLYLDHALVLDYAHRNVL